MSCISLQGSAMLFVPGQMIGEVNSIATTDCCTPKDHSGDNTDQDCDGICACCITTVSGDRNILYFEYLISIGYLKHNTAYQEGSSQLVIKSLEQPPRGQFNSDV